MCVCVCVYIGYSLIFFNFISDINPKGEKFEMIINIYGKVRKPDDRKSPPTPSPKRDEPSIDERVWRPARKTPPSPSPKLEYPKGGGHISRNIVNVYDNARTCMFMFYNFFYT